MADDGSLRLLDPEIFESLKSKLEEETQVREDLTQILRKLEAAVSYAQGLLSRIHSTRRPQYAPLLAQVEAGIQEEIAIVRQLSEVASQHPYYKYNQKWSRTVQNAVLTALLCGWLGGMATESRPGELGRLLTLEDMGEIFQVPVNLKDRDAFHITIEEYLLALTDLTSELSRLATNAVTLGDFEMAVKISGFIKDLFAGFQVLNLKNDILRKRVDGVKYDVKKVEDIVYDLSLRNLIPNPEATSSS